MRSEGNETVLADKNSLRLIIDLLDELNIRYWVEGGWGIDILIGKQTRDHRDIDIDFDANAESELLEKLAEQGYKIVIDERPTRVELYHPQYGYLDLHPFELSEPGMMKQANPAGGWFELSSDWFTESSFDGRRIPCVSVEGQRLFHSGYEQREIDQIDLKNLNEVYPQGKEQE